MTTQTSLFDAIAARDAAIQQVDDAADPGWKDIALDVVYGVCCGHRTFTSETIWQYIEKPREPRALGPVLMRAVKRGYCEPMGFVTSSMTSRHAAPVRQYRSLIGG